MPRRKTIDGHDAQDARRVLLPGSRRLHLPHDQSSHVAGVRRREEARSFVQADPQWGRINQSAMPVKLRACTPPSVAIDEAKARPRRPEAGRAERTGTIQ